MNRKIYKTQKLADKQSTFEKLTFSETYSRQLSFSRETLVEFHFNSHYQKDNTVALPCLPKPWSLIILTKSITGGHAKYHYLIIPRWRGREILQSRIPEYNT